MTSLATVNDAADGIRAAVARHLGRRRRLYTAHDLVEDVGLSEEAFGEVLRDLETQFGVLFDPENEDALRIVGVLLVTLLWLCKQATLGAAVALKAA